MKYDSDLTTRQVQDGQKTDTSNDHALEIKRLTRLALAARNAKKNAAIDLQECEATLSHWTGDTRHALPTDAIPMLFASTGSEAVVGIVRYLADQLGYDLTVRS
jgi:hypothetical protein